MKKIIIMFITISILLVSYSINATLDDISVTTPTNNPSGDNENTDNGNDTPPTENGTNSENPTNDGDTTHDNPSGDNENTDSESDITNNTDVNHFEYESGKTVYNYDYEVIYNNSPVNSDFLDTCLEVAIPSYGIIYLNILETENRIEFTSCANDIKVHNVTVDRITSPKFTVTIELVDNN